MPELIDIIVALDEALGIGKDGTIPWKPPRGDMKRFRELTDDAACIMGRATWESLPEAFRPLPNRLSIVVTGGGADVTCRLRHDSSVAIVSSWEEATFVGFAMRDRVVAMGGVRIYEAALADDRCRTIHCSRVPDEHGCDVYMPTVRSLFGGGLFEEYDFRLSSYESHDDHRYEVYSR